MKKESVNFLESTKTKAGYEVKGLFVDGKYIRGHSNAGGIWRSGTWLKKSGLYITSTAGHRHLDLVAPVTQLSNKETV